jgi:hypothetical protein
MDIQDVWAVVGLVSAFFYLIFWVYPQLDEISRKTVRKILDTIFFVRFFKRQINIYGKKRFEKYKGVGKIRCYKCKSKKVKSEIVEIDICGTKWMCVKITCMHCGHKMQKQIASVKSLYYKESEIN